MRLAAFAGSWRTGSFNRKLLAIAVAKARALGADVDVVDLRALGLPIYDGDDEAASGAPPGAVELKKRLGAAAGFIVASPEYNHSIPGGLKNAIDWASRPPDVPFSGRPAAILGASPGGFGAVRGLAHVRQTLTALDVWVLPRQVTVSAAHKAFGPDDQLLDPKLDAQVGDLVAALVEVVRRST